MDSAGRPFATMVHDEMSQNHQGGINDLPTTEMHEYLNLTYLTMVIAPWYSTCQNLTHHVQHSFRTIQTRNQFPSTAMCGTKRGHSEFNHQQNSRSFQGIRKIQREGDSDYFVIKCRSSQSAYYGYFWAPRRTKPCALQHDAFNSLQLNSKRDVQQTKVIHQVQSSPTSVTYGYKLNICLLHCFELSY